MVSFKEILAAKLQKKPFALNKDGVAGATGLTPIANDEKKFMDAHQAVEVEDGAGNGDDFFKGANVKMFDREVSRYGYNPDTNIDKEFRVSKEEPRRDFRSFLDLPNRLVAKESVKDEDEITVPSLMQQLAQEREPQPKQLDEKNWIQGAIKHPGAEKRAAKRAHMSTHAYEVKHEDDGGKAGRRARLGLLLSKMAKHKKKVNEEVDSLQEDTLKTLEKQGLRFKCPSCGSLETPFLNWSRMSEESNPAKCPECNTEDAWVKFLDESVNEDAKDGNPYDGKDMPYARDKQAEEYRERKRKNKHIEKVVKFERKNFNDYINAFESVNEHDADGDNDDEFHALMKKHGYEVEPQTYDVYTKKDDAGDHHIVWDNRNTISKLDIPPFMHAIHLEPHTELGSLEALKNHLDHVHSPEQVKLRKLAKIAKHFESEEIDEQKASYYRNPILQGGYASQQQMGHYVHSWNKRSLRKVGSRRHDQSFSAQKFHIKLAPNGQWILLSRDGSVVFGKFSDRTEALKRSMQLRGRTSKNIHLKATSKPQSMTKVPDSTAHYQTHVHEDEVISEVLGPDATVQDYIQDFVHSKNPRFDGKSRKERIRMALGAFYGRHRRHK